MPRIVLGGLAAAILLLLPATAQGDSAASLQGAVASKNVSTHLVSVRSTKRVVGLRVPGSLAAIRVGQRVELRGATLRSRGRGSRVLARNVTVVGSAARATTTGTRSTSDDDVGHDEVEITGTLTSLSPLTVASPTRTVSCAVPAGMSVSGFAVGELVEMTCDLTGGTWVVRKLEHEDDEDEADADDDHGGNSGPGSADDDDHDDDHGGPGGGDDDDGDDDHGGHSGPGGGDDD
jgi:hypothetical protein